MLLPDLAGNEGFRRRFLREAGYARTVEDLGSTNGTLRNGRAIEGPEPLAVGDEPELGSTTLVVRTRAPAPGTLTLRLVLDPGRGRAGVTIEGGPDAAMLRVEGGQWRLRSE